MILALALAGVQDDPAELIRRLRSDRAEERDEAARKLADLGGAAAPALESARLDKDEDFARRAADILRTIDRRRQLDALRKAGRLRSADFKNLTIEQAAAEVLGGFDVRFKVDPLGLDLETAAVTLQFKDADFWEAVDLFCRAAVVRVDVPFVLSGDCIELKISRPLPWPVHFATVGDVRVYANLVVMGAVGENNFGDLSPKLTVVFAPWAAPKRARIEEVKVAGQSLENSGFYRRLGADGQDLPRKAGLLTGAEMWYGGCAKRESLKGAKTLTVEGTLVLVRDDGREERIPFSIPNMAVPPPPKR